MWTFVSALARLSTKHLTLNISDGQLRSWSNNFEMIIPLSLSLSLHTRDAMIAAVIILIGGLVVNICTIRTPRGQRRQTENKELP